MCAPNTTVIGLNNSALFVYHKPMADFTITSHGDGTFSVTDKTGGYGVNTFSAVAGLQFSDQTVTLSYTPSASITAEFFGNNYVTIRHSIIEDLATNIMANLGAIEHNVTNISLIKISDGGKWSESWKFF